jgi:hypothetical protein
LEKPSRLGLQAAHQLHIGEHVELLIIRKLVDVEQLWLEVLVEVKLGQEVAHEVDNL